MLQEVERAVELHPHQLQPLLQLVVSGLDIPAQRVMSMQVLVVMVAPMVAVHFALTKTVERATQVILLAQIMFTRAVAAVVLGIPLALAALLELGAQALVMVVILETAELLLIMVLAAAALITQVLAVPVLLVLLFSHYPLMHFRLMRAVERYRLAPLAN